MGFLGINWDNVGDRIGSAVSSSFNYVASGQILDDAATVAVKTGETLSYIAQNPGHSARIALEGIEEGVGTATGLVVGGASDVFNASVRGAGYLAGRDWELYQGGFGTGIHSVNRFVTEGIDSVEAAIGIEEPVIRNEYDRYIFGAAQGMTEVGASVALIAATGGAGAMVVGGNGLGVASGIMAGSVNTTLAATVTGAATLYGVGNNIDQQLQLRDAEIGEMNAILPGLLEQAMPLPSR